jgi:hypothetical protein
MNFMFNDKMSLFLREAYNLNIFENKVLREMSAVRNAKSYVRKNFVIHIVLLVLFRLLSLHISYTVCKMDNVDVDIYIYWCWNVMVIRETECA